MRSPINVCGEWAVTYKYVDSKLVQCLVQLDRVSDENVFKVGKSASNFDTVMLEQNGRYCVSGVLKSILLRYIFLAVTKQLYEWFHSSVRTSHLFIRPFEKKKKKTRSYYAVAISASPSVQVFRTFFNML